MVLTRALRGILAALRHLLGTQHGQNALMMVLGYGMESALAYTREKEA